MSPPPRPKKKKIIDKRLRWLVAVIGFQKVAVLLIIFCLGMKMGGYNVVNTVLFTTIVLYAFVRVAVIQVEEDIPIFINKWVNLAILASFLLQLFVLYTPVNTFFGVVPPSLSRNQSHGGSFIPQDAGGRRINPKDTLFSSYFSCPHFFPLWRPRISSSVKKPSPFVSLFLNFSP
jgi:magnesium-transporting ATPase (P-type)